MSPFSKKVLVYMGHPAHYHLFSHFISILHKSGCEVLILIKKKDILEELVRSSGLEYKNINPEGRKDSRMGIISGLIKREFQFIKHVRKFRPDIMIGTSAEIAHVGKLFNIPSLVVNEDDAEVVPYFARVAYPFASNIIAPECTSVGKWESKKIPYNGYHELAYLHPDHFKPDDSVPGKYVSKDRYFIIRFAKLTAHHDEGRQGISDDIARKLVELLSPKGDVIISTERDLPPDLEKFHQKLDPTDMHNLLYFADIYIGDSQTMAAESAVLGTASIRFNDFVGEISYLEELEKEFNLTFGIRTNEPEKLFTVTEALLKDDSLKSTFKERRNRMLTKKINSADFMAWLVMNYPESANLMSYDSTHYESKVMDPSLV